jgi:hypothetical protein
LLLLQQISSKTPALVAIFVGPLKTDGSGLAEAPAPLIPPVY